MEEDELDPRIQVELEKLNTATDEINKLEIELDEANTTFRMLLGECTRRLKVHSSKNGSAIVSARPYYEALDVARNAQQECQQAAVSFQRANEVHEAAKETVALAEARFKSQPEWRFDSAWQEMLNHATLKVRDAEKQRAETAAYHGHATARYKDAQDKVHQLEQRLRRNVAKSRPYFEEKQRCNDQLAAQKEVVESLQAHVAMVKSGYASSLRRLEGISEEIHRKRANLMAACCGVREPGVGAELEYTGELEYKGELDRCDEPRSLPADTDSEPGQPIGQGEPDIKTPSHSSNQEETGSVLYSLQGPSTSELRTGKGEPGAKTKTPLSAFSRKESLPSTSSNVRPCLVDSSGSMGGQTPSDSCSKDKVASSTVLSHSLQDESCVLELHKAEQQLAAYAVSEIDIEKRGHGESVSSTNVYNLEELNLTYLESNTGEPVLNAETGVLQDDDRGETVLNSENEELVFHEKEVVLQAKLTLGDRPTQVVAEISRTPTPVPVSSLTVLQEREAIAMETDVAVESSSVLNECVVERRLDDAAKISTSVENVSDAKFVDVKLSSAAKLSLETEKCLALEVVKKNMLDNKLNSETESHVVAIDEKDALISAPSTSGVLEQEPNLEGGNGQD